MTRRLTHNTGDFIGPGRDQYRVIRLISIGGMGSVYEVENTITGDHYAVKECDVLDGPDGKGISRETALTSFLREARQIEALTHPHIPDGFLVIDRDASARICGHCGNPVTLPTCDSCNLAPDDEHHQSLEIDGRYYLFMTYINGCDSDEKLAESPRPLSGADLTRLCHWMGQIASALAFLHESGLMHRDIKPENIRIDRENKAWLLDLGLLCQEAPEPGRAPQMPDDTRELGTAGYAPPEQAAGNPNRSSDIYASAMTLLHLASGLDPEDPDTRHTMLTTDPRELVPSLEPEMAEILRAALSTDPAVRPDAGTWRDALSPQAPTPVEHKALTILHPPSTDPNPHPDTAQPSAPRRKPHLLIAAVVIVATTLLLLYLFVPADTVRPFDVEAKPGSIIFTDPTRPGEGLKLTGGEILSVKYVDPKVGTNLLRVLSVDGKRRRGYLQRDKVFRRRE